MDGLGAISTKEIGSKPVAKKHWMAKAFSNAHGQFKAKAEAAGESTAAYAEKEKNAPGRLGKQARLALVGIRSKK